jgi:uncharacterized protein (TIGR02145 family)
MKQGNYIRYRLVRWSGIFLLSLLFSVSANTQDVQEISLRSGWNLFSTCLVPDTADPALMFAPVISQGMVIKDDDGQIFWGFYGVNQIGNIVAGNGYSLRLDSAFDLIVNGSQVNPLYYSIAVPMGWSFLGYLRDYSSCTDSVIDDLSYLLLKDEDGQVNWPQFGVSQVELMRPGKAYQLFTDSAQQFFFPDNSFICGADLLNDADGNSYETVLLDSGCWMASNLNIGNQILIQTNSTNNGIVEKYCYNNDSVLCAQYGGLYKWNELMDYQLQAGGQGICPSGWHVPSDSEWKSLELFLGMDSLFLDIIGWRGSNEGQALQSGGSSGFNALLSGYMIPNQTFYGNNLVGNFYTSSVFTGDNALFRQIGSANSGINRYFGAKTFAYSVRCLMDEDTCLTIPSQADAGNDQLGLVAVSTSLEANLPLEGQGLWTILTGNGGFLSNPTSPVSTISGFGGNAYTLEWSITTACNVSRDTVEISFSSVGDSCGQVFIDIRDGQVYHTVQIGSQCWMSDNLNVGTQISCLCNQFDDNVIEKYCYDNTAAYCDTLGGMYQWDEIMDYDTIPGGTGICPAGWHIPSDTEYQILESTLGMSASELAIMNNWRGSNEGSQMKEGGSSGFDGQLAGRRVNGTFSVLHEFGYFWTSNQDGIHAIGRSLRATDGKVGRYNVYPKFFGLPVRCVKDPI